MAADSAAVDLVAAGDPEEALADSVAAHSAVVVQVAVGKIVEERVTQFIHIRIGL